MSAFTATYLMVLVVLALAEGLAIGNPKRGDTISEHVWVARASVLLVWPLCVLWVWATFHLLAPWEPDGKVANDVAYLVLGALVAAVNVAALEKKRRG